MNATDVIKQTYSLSNMVLSSYVNDLSDAELLTRPAEGCNHVAWQLGHLIHSECGLLDSIVPGYSVSLPEGFAEHHAKENTTSEDPSQFLSTAEYLDLFSQMKTATFAALDSLSNECLDRPGPEHLASMCPTVGSVFVLIATHAMMHVGQIVPVRRKLDKPIVI